MGGAGGLPFRSERRGPVSVADSGDGGIRGWKATKARTKAPKWLAKRRAQEKAALAGLYAAFGRQFPRLKKALSAQRYELEALQAEAQALRQKAIGTSPFDLDGLDWSDEESLLTADLEPVFRAVLKEAVLEMALEHANLGVQVSWDVYNAQAAEYARQYSYGLIKQINDSTRTQMGQTIGRWIESGETFPQLTDRIWKLVPANPFPNMRDRAQVIAATETTRVFADTQRMALQAAGLRSVVWATGNDEAVCEICGPLDGKVGSVEHGFVIEATGNMIGAPPAHVNCRCWLLPATDELEQRAQEVPADKPTKAEVQAAVEPATAAAPAPTKPPVFQTTKEAEKWGRDNLGVPNVHYGKLPPDTANAINEAVQEHFEQYPELRKRMEFVGSNQERAKLLKTTKLPSIERQAEIYAERYRKMGRYTEAEIEGARQRYIKQALSHAVGKTPARNWGLAYAKGSFELPGITFNERNPILVKDLLRGIETQYHPAGATQVRSVVDHELGHQFDYLLKLRNDRAISGIIRETAELPGGIKGNLSDYARKNNAEFIAESWAEYVNSPSPRPTAKAVGEYLIKRYKELYP